MRTIYIIDIEPLDNRYTKQWQTHIPEMIKQTLPQLNVLQISGDNTGYDKPSVGSFFDFSATMTYKNSQAHAISKLFSDNKIKPNDIFLFTDAWNPTVHTVRYISELNNIPVKVYGIWHAGWYDKTDILGYTIKNTNWVKNLELSMFNAYDINFFGTGHHVDTFKAQHQIDKGRAMIVGYPLDYLKDISSDYNKKLDMIVFPHRLNDDKAPYVFDHISNILSKLNSNIICVKTQEHNLSKDLYYELIGKAKIVFSANKHENLGISTYECMRSGCVPVVPDKLSYTDIYPIQYRYTLTDNMYTDLDSWYNIAVKMLGIIENYDIHTYNTVLQDANRIHDNFFSCKQMLHIIGRQ